MKRPEALKRALDLLEQADEFVVFATLQDEQPGEDGKYAMSLLALMPDVLSKPVVDGIRMWLDAGAKPQPEWTWSKNEELQ